MNNKAYNNSSNINSHIASYSSLAFYIVIGLIIFICFTFTSCGRASADDLDISYIVSVFQASPDYDPDVMSYLGSSYKQYVCFEDDDFFYACFYPTSNFYTTFGYVSVFYIEFDYNYSDNWYVYRENATFDSSILTSAYNSNKLGIGAFARFNKNNNSLFIFESRCSSLSSTNSENLQTYCAGDTDLSDPVNFGTPFYHYTRYDRISDFDKNILVGSWSSKSTVRFERVYNRFASVPNLGCVNPSYAFKFQFTQSAPSGPSYTDDSRLKFSTSLRGDGEKLLNTDLSDFLHWGPSAGMSVSDLVLTLDCDGVEVPVSLDSNNSEIIFTKNQNDYSYRCVYVTPYSELGLDAYEDVSIVKCDFTRTYNHLGPDSPEVEDFKISCNYILKNETAPIESDTISLDTSVDSDKLTAIEITDLHNSFQFSEGEFVSDLSDIVSPDNFSFVEICVSTLPLQTLNNILSYVPYILLTPEAGVNATQAAEKVIYEYLEDNYYTCVFDYLIFDWVFYDDPEDPSAGYDHLYFYYNTLSGRVRLIDNVLGDIYVDVNQNTANTAAIYNYLYTRLNDFENKSLDAFNDIIGLDRQRNTWFGTLSSGINNLSLISSNGFADVVDAVNAIEFDFVPFDDSDILSALSGIASQLSSILGRDDNEDDTVSEAIAYYQLNNSSGLPTQQVFTDNKMSLWMSGKVHVWLQGSTAADSRQGLLIDSFDFMTQFYDSLQSHGLIGGVRNYVRSFTSGTSSGSAETVYKTIWTGSFNPNLKDGV